MTGGRMRLAARSLRYAQHALREHGVAERRERVSALGGAALVGAASATAVCLGATRAEADAGATTMHGMAPSPPMPNFPPMHSPPVKERWIGLTHGDLATALSAVEEVCALAHDGHNHKMLVQSGAIPALCAALRRALEGGELPLAARALAALADLARTSAAEAAFRDAAPLLVDALRRHPVNIESPGWGAWLARQVSFGSTGNASPPLTPVVSPTLALPQVDIGVGIASDALRCMANVARESSAHPALLEAGALTVASDVLRRAPRRVLEDACTNDVQLLESLRSATCVVGALAKSAPRQVVQNKAHHCLVDYCGSNADGVTRSYATGGVRNLARHPPPEEEKDRWRVHREVVVAGAGEALASALEAGDQQTRLFALLALGDLTSSGHHKAHLIHRHLKAAYAVAVPLATESVNPVGRAAARFVCSAYEAGHHSPELSAVVATSAAIWTQGAIASGDALVLKAAALAARDASVADAFVAGGIASALLAAVQKGRGAYFDCAVQATAALAFHEKPRVALFDAGVIRAALKRPASGHAVRFTATLAAEAARDAERRAEVAHASLPFLVDTIVRDNSSDGGARSEACRALHNLAAHGGAARVMVAQAGAAQPLVDALRSPLARVAAAGTLASTAEAFEYAPTLAAAGAPAALVAAAKQHQSTADGGQLATSAARTLACISLNEQVHPTITNDVVEWAVQQMRKPLGGPETHYYAVLAVCNLSYTEAQRDILRKAGAVDVLKQLAAALFGAPDVLGAARQALANFAGDAPPAMLPVQSEGREAPFL